MSNIKISEMPSATSVGGSDIIPIVQDGVSKKLNVEDLSTNLSDIVTITHGGSSSAIAISTTKVSLASGTRTFVGGKYLVVTQPIFLKFSSDGSGFILGVTIDGTDNEIYSTAKLGYSSLDGCISALGTIDIPEGEHTLDFYGVTNHSVKTATIGSYVGFKIFFIKIGS